MLGSTWSEAFQRGGQDGKEATHSGADHQHCGRQRSVGPRQIREADQPGAGITEHTYRWRREYRGIEITVASFGLIDGLYGVAYALGQFIWGISGDKFGPRKVVLAAACYDFFRNNCRGHGNVLHRDTFRSALFLPGSLSIHRVGAPDQECQLLVFPTRTGPNLWVLGHQLRYRGTAGQCVCRYSRQERGRIWPVRLPGIWPWFF